MKQINWKIFGILLLLLAGINILAERLGHSGSHFWTNFRIALLAPAATLNYLFHAFHTGKGINLLGWGQLICYAALVAARFRLKPVILAGIFLLHLILAIIWILLLENMRG